VWDLPYPNFTFPAESAGKNLGFKVNQYPEIGHLARLKPPGYNCEVMTMPTPLRRRWFQFSMNNLLIATCLCAVGVNALLLSTGSAWRFGSMVILGFALIGLAVGTIAHWRFTFATAGALAGALLVTYAIVY
jgi:hypothetical protein